jgi:hypothetical protein
MVKAVFEAEHHLGISLAPYATLLQTGYNMDGTGGAL